jgi:hypothetical protein
MSGVLVEPRLRSPDLYMRLHATWQLFDRAPKERSSADVANRSRHRRVGMGMTRLTTYALAIAVFAVLLLTVAGCGKGGGY